MHHNKGGRILAPIFLQRKFKIAQITDVWRNFGSFLGLHVRQTAKTKFWVPFLKFSLNNSTNETNSINFGHKSAFQGSVIISLISKKNKPTSLTWGSLSVGGRPNTFSEPSKPRPNRTRQVFKMIGLTAQTEKKAVKVSQMMTMCHFRKFCLSSDPK